MRRHREGCILVHVVQRPRVALATLDLALPAPALTYCLWTRAREGAGRLEVRVRHILPPAEAHPSPAGEAGAVVPHPTCVCTWPCRCGLPLCRRREPGLARGQRNCPTIAAVLFQFNKGVMRNNEVSVLSCATCSGARGAPSRAQRLPQSPVTCVRGSSRCWAQTRGCRRRAGLGGAKHSSAIPAAPCF